MKYSVTYLLIIVAALIFLNHYAGTTTRRLVAGAQKNMMEDKLQVAVAGFSRVEQMHADTAARVMAQLGDLNMTRVIVTDQSAKAVYDSLEDSALGKPVLFPEVVQALEGNDVVYGVFREDGLEIRGAMPVLYRGTLVGAVYMMNFDRDQVRLVRSLESNLSSLSLALVGAIVVFSLVFTVTFSRRMGSVLQSIRIIREGDYTHRMRTRGRDEISMLGEEFNSLTERLLTSEERRRQFVSDASHELKTPLASIKLLSDSILQNEMDRDTLREFVGDIGSEADRLTRMSQKLLCLTRGDAGSEEQPQREIVDLGQTAQRVLRMLTPVAQLHNVTLEDRTIPGCTILMLEDDLYQVIFNLVENGIKYNLSGGSLTVGVARREDDVLLTVEDTGVGIPDDALPYIFDRFYRVDKARSRQAGGSGLGLSIVHDMVLRNDGTITVTHRKGGGTCFAVTFPAFDME